MSLIAVFLLGLSVGLTACARAGGGWAAAEDLAAFLGGRLAGYAAMGAAAGWAGETLAAGLRGPAGHVAIGVAGLAAAAALAFGTPGRSCRAASSGLPPFGLGVALSLTPCVPLASLLAAAALGGSPGTGAGMGVAFGLGAAVTPLLVAVPLLGLFGRAVADRPELQRWLRWGGALVLASLGARRLLLLLPGG